MDGSDAFWHQTEAEQDCHQHEQPVARWVAQQQEELAGAEGSLVDHHINGKYASIFSLDAAPVSQLSATMKTMAEQKPKTRRSKIQE